MKKLLTAAAAIALAVTLTGCKNSSPLTYSLATSTIVSYGLRNSPKTADYLRAVQKPLCAAAMGEALTPNDFVEAVELSGVEPGSPEALAILDGAMLLYITAYDNLGSKTNVAAAAPYAHAIFCVGFERGLAGAPSSKDRNAPPKKVWRLLRKP